MCPFGNRAKLIRLINHLAFYNDKGISYARHSPARIQAKRSSGVAKLRELVAVVGPDSLPPTFLQAIDSGDVATDLTGQYIDFSKRTSGARVRPTNSFKPKPPGGSA